MQRLAKLPQHLYIPVVYCGLSISWIMLGDSLVHRLWLHADLSQSEVFWAGMIKGLVFVGLSTGLLYYLIQKATVSMTDITENFRRLFEENPNPMWIYDLETLRFVLVNDTACQVYGYSKDEFLALNLYDIRPKDEHTRLKEDISKPQSTYADSGIWLHRDKRGQQFYVHIFSHRTFYQQRPCRLVTAINVHDRVIAEQEKSNIGKALDASTILTVTDTNGVILDVNDKFCELSQYTREESIGTPYHIVNSGHHPKEFWQDMWQTISAGRTWKGEIRNKAKDGSNYWVSTVINPVVGPDGKMYKFMAIQQDITARKQLETQQQALLDDLAAYAYQTSHKLRGPLARMLGLTHLFHQHPDATFMVEKLRETSEEMDLVIREMNYTLNRSAYLLIEKRREEQQRQH